MSRRKSKGKSEAEARASAALAGGVASADVPWAGAWLSLAFLLPNLVTLSFGFVYDDLPIIVENGRLHGLGRLTEIWTGGYWPDRPGLTAYRPVVQSIWAALWTLGRGQPFVYHLFGLAVGLGVVLVVHRLLLSLGVPLRSAFVASLLFATLPIHTEVTASVVGSAESLAALLGLSALLFYRRGRWPLALALWAISVFCKESAAALPALIPLLWRWEEGGRPRPKVLLAHAAAAGSVVGLALLARSVVAKGPVFIPPIDNPMSLVSGPQRVLTALWGQVVYLVRSAVPVHLSADTSYREIPLVMGPEDPRAWAGLLLLGAATAAFLYRPRARLPIALWVVPFLATANVLFPVGTMLGERLAFLPTVGLCLFLAGAAARLPRRAALAAVGVLLVAYGARTAQRNLVWRDADAFYPRLAVDAPDSARAWYSLGVWHSARVRDAEALASYDRALAIFEPYPEAWNNRGNALVALGRIDEAKESYRQAVRFDPGHRGAAASLSALEQGILFTPQRKKL